jgi:hypothetical protein
MSEKIYAWLLHLYPSQFREAYGSEALQLFRDRARNETGFLARLQLWLDVLFDLALSVPREHLRTEPEFLSASVPVSRDGPSFLVLARQPLRATVLLSGGMLSLAALLMVSVLLNRGVRPVPLSALFHRAGAATDAASPASSSPAPQPAAFKPQKGTVASQQQLGVASGNSVQPPQRQPEASAEIANRSLGESKLDATERKRVIDAAATILKKDYIDRDNAQKMADALLAHYRRGDDSHAADGNAFAALLTRQMRDVSPDRHLELVYSQERLPDHPAGETPEGIARYSATMKQLNCTFEKVEILPHNIGYLKLNSFPDPSVCQSTATAAMASLNHADAIIFDLRDNRGGEPAMVMFLAAYLFDHPEYMYNPRENTTEHSWTRSPVPGNNLADKPAYILVSQSTISGAEHFSYDLKMLKRATLVGETTGGAAHSGVWHRIDDHFGIAIPEAKAINPFATSDWAEIGVEPDVKVTASDALTTAEKLAQDSLRKK